MGKIRDLFNKISCKDGYNKGQKWYGPNIPGSYALPMLSDLVSIISEHDPDNHDAVITDLEPDIL